MKMTSLWLALLGKITYYYFILFLKPARLHIICVVPPVHSSVKCYSIYVGTNFTSFSRDMFEFMCTGIIYIQNKKEAGNQ